MGHAKRRQKSLGALYVRPILVDHDRGRALSMPLSISFLRFLIVRAWLDFTLVMASCASGSSE
jgi:hypothetical protein